MVRALAFVLDQPPKNSSFYSNIIVVNLSLKLNKYTLRVTLSARATAAAGHLKFCVILLHLERLLTVADRRTAAGRHGRRHRRHGRTEVGVLALAVTPQVDFALERLVAHAALERLVAGMLAHVRYEIGALAERLLAHDAHVRFLA